MPQNRRTHVRDSNSENDIFSVTDCTITLYLTYYRCNFYLNPVSDNSTHRHVCFSDVPHIWVTYSCMSVHCDLTTCTHIFHCHMIQITNILFQTLRPFLLLPILFNLIIILLTLSKPTPGSNESESTMQWYRGLFLRGPYCQGVNSPHTSNSSSP